MSTENAINVLYQISIVRKRSEFDAFALGLPDAFDPFLTIFSEPHLWQHFTSKIIESIFGAMKLNHPKPDTTKYLNQQLSFILIASLYL